MTRFKEAVQLGDNVTDIMKLPCVVSCFKANDKNGYEWLMYKVQCGERIELVEQGDWLCKDDAGRWHALDNELYQAMARR